MGVREGRKEAIIEALFAIYAPGRQARRYYADDFMRGFTSYETTEQQLRYAVADISDHWKGIQPPDREEVKALLPEVNLLYGILYPSPLKKRG